MIKLGSNNMVGAYLGDAPISKIYLGDVLVYGGGAEPTYTVRYTYVNGLYEDIVYEDGIAKADAVGVKELVEVEVGEGITKLADDFVSDCDNLATVSLPSTLTEIGLRAFKGCSNLSLINLPRSVETIGDEAFAQCTSLNYFYLHSTPTFELGSSQSPKGAFSGCSDIDFYLSGMTSDEMERWLLSETESGYVVSEFIYGTREETVSVFKSTVVMHCSNGSGTLNQMVAYIKDGEVYADLFSDGKIPSSKYKGTTITEVEIGEAITEIGGYAFQLCSSLTSVTIPNSVTLVQTYAISSCKSLLNVEIGNSVTNIGTYAFSNCTSLTSITIPDSVNIIGDGAFQLCNKLKNVNIGIGVRTLGTFVFRRDTSLETITCNATTAPTVTYNTFNGIKSNGTLYYPSGSDYSRWLSTSNYYLGYYNWNGQPIAQGGTVTLTMEDGTTSAVTYSDGVIPMQAFYNNKEIVKVEIGDGITKIGGGAFMNCWLEEITIGKDVTEVGTIAFMSCPYLTKITCLSATAPTIDYQTFYNVNRDGTLYYPQGSDYSHWLSTANYYLGCYDWSGQVIVDNNEIGGDEFAGEEGEW